MVCTLCKYLFDSMRRCISILMVCVDVSYLEPKQKKEKGDIICKVTLYA